MDINSIKQMVDDSISKPEEELKKELPALMDSFDNVNIEELVKESPDLVPKLMGKLNEINIKSFIDDSPETSVKFMNLLWKSVPVLAEKDSEASSRLAQAGEVTINFKADDSSMTSHLKIADGKLTGGSDLLSNAELSIFGPTDNIVGLLTGKVNPIQGFMAGKYKMDGNISKGMQLSPFLTSITKLFA